MPHAVSWMIQVLLITNTNHPRRGGEGREEEEEEIQQKDQEAECASECGQNTGKDLWQAERQAGDFAVRKLVSLY